MITGLSEIWDKKKGAIPNFSNLSATTLDDPNVYDSVCSLVSSTWKSWDRVIWDHHDNLVMLIIFMMGGLGGMRIP